MAPVRVAFYGCLAAAIAIVAPASGFIKDTNVAKINNSEAVAAKSPPNSEALSTGTIAAPNANSTRRRPQ